MNYTKGEWKAYWREGNKTQSIQETNAACDNYTEETEKSLNKAEGVK